MALLSTFNQIPAKHIKTSGEPVGYVLGVVSDGGGQFIPAAAAAASQQTIPLINGLNSGVEGNGSSSLLFGGYSALGAAVIFGGLDPASVVAGQPIELTFTIAGCPVIIRNLDAGSPASMQIVTPTGQDFPLPPGQSPTCRLLRNGSSGWILQTGSATSIHVVNVKDFGATGNGTTDDTSAFVNAFAYLASVGGGELRVPAGTYLYSTTIFVPNYVIVRGAGSGSTKMLQNFVGDGFQFLNILNSSTASQNTIQDITFDGTVNTPYWNSFTEYALGQIVRPLRNSPVFLKCVVPGKSGGTAINQAVEPIGQLTPGSINGESYAASGTIVCSTASGSVPEPYWLQFVILVGGAVGTATFAYYVSTNLGASWTLVATGISTASAVPLTGPYAGVTAYFAGTSFIASSVYTATYINHYSGDSPISSAPLVWITGNPTDSYTNAWIDIDVTTAGVIASGAVQFAWSLSLNGGETWAAAGGNIIPASGVFALGSTGLTAHFSPGYYGINQCYLSPSFGWSSNIGTTIVDGTVTWEIVDAGAALDFINGGSITVQRVVFGSSNINIGIILDQAEIVLIRDITYNCVISWWIPDGATHLPYSNALPQIANDIHFQGWQFHNNAIMGIDEGGVDHNISGGTAEGGQQMFFAYAFSVTIENWDIEGGGTPIVLLGCTFFGRSWAFPGYGFIVRDSYISASPIIDAKATRNNAKGSAQLVWQGVAVENCTTSGQGSAPAMVVGAANLQGLRWVNNNYGSGSITALTDAPLYSGQVLYEDYENGIIIGADQTVTVANTYAVDSGSLQDSTILCNLSAAKTITLPPPTLGRSITITDIAGNAATDNITIDPNASEKINGASSYVISSNRGSVSLRSDGTNWFVVGKV